MNATPEARFPDPGSSNDGLQPPRGYRLPSATRIHGVTLQVSDLSRSLRFYQQVIGLRLLSVSTTEALLGAPESTEPLVTLIENRGPRRRSTPKALGLYHVAILLPSRGALGRFLRHLGEIGARAAASDHLVSEALYLQDPDNLGLEIYADRPRSTWTHRDRQLVMASDPLDAGSVVAAGGTAPWTGVPTGTVIGHVHLHVGDIDQGGRFYGDALGFDRTVWSYPGALFLAAGGYHHHLGTNIWAGPGARAPEPDDPQLLEWVLELPFLADVAAAAGNLQSSGVAVATETSGDVTVRDPWRTSLRLSTPR